MGNIKKKLEKVYEECTRLYEQGGVSAVIDHVNEQFDKKNPMFKNVHNRYCTQCNADMPTLFNVCLVCGSAVHAEIGRKILTIGEVKELLSDLNDDDIAVLETCDEHGDVQDLYPMYIDVIDGIELKNGKTVNEVRFCQMPNTKPEEKSNLVLGDGAKEFADEFVKTVNKNIYSTPIEINTGIIDSKNNEIKEDDTIKTILVCPNCKSDNVQVMMWVNANTNKPIDSAADEGTEDWCDDCRTHQKLDLVTLKSKAKVIGFQVVGEEHSEEEGNIHPNMDASFCIYNLQQAREMLTNDNWRLLAIWEGDIEEPTMMFEGDPRD